MNTFYYKARDRRGLLIQGQVDANDAPSARKQIASLQLIPIEVNDRPAPLTVNQLITKIKDSFQSITTEEMIVFNHQVQTAYSVGMPLGKALLMIAEQTENQYFARVVKQITNDINTGLQLNQALARHPKLFDVTYVNLVKAGEASGELEAILERISTLLERKAETKAKIKSATLYPIITICFLIFVTLFVSLFVIPKIKDFLERFHVELPMVTKMVIGFSDFLIHFWPVIIAAGVFAVWFAKFLLAIPKIKDRWDIFWLKFPVFGKLFIEIDLNSFSIILSLLISSGVGIIESFKLVQHSMKNSLLRKEIERSRKEVAAGSTITAALQKCKYFPPLFINMVNMGENTGELTKLLRKIADYYRIQIDYKVTNLPKFLEPVLLFFVMGLLLIVALAVFLPIWKMSAAVKSGGA